MDYVIYLCQIIFRFAVAEVKSLPGSSKTLEGSLRVNRDVSQLLNELRLAPYQFPPRSV